MAESSILIGLGVAIVVAIIYGLNHIQRAISRGNEINVASNEMLAETLKKLDAIYERLDSISGSTFLLSERFEAKAAYDKKAPERDAEIKRVLDNLVRPEK